MEARRTYVNIEKKKNVKPIPKEEEGIVIHNSDLYSVPFKNTTSGTNITKCFQNSQEGINGNIKRCADIIVGQRFKHYEVSKMFSPFFRRITSMAWHPKDRLLVAGTKGGEMGIYSLLSESEIKQVKCWDGDGPSESILDSHFPEFLSERMIVVSLDGSVIVQNYDHPYAKKVLASSGSMRHWYCSVTSSHVAGLILMGSSKGSIAVLNKDLKLILTKNKVHKSKITSIDFDGSGIIYATASIDHTVKLYDVRKLSSPIVTLIHEKAVNAARFKGNMLLTTDQGNEIRVYSGPSWRYNAIKHPHRHYQHLTQIRAAWHPICDLIIVGRYPSEKDAEWSNVRSVDIISAHTGSLLAQLDSPMVPGITSIAKFDPTGEIIVSATGRNLIFWKNADPVLPTLPKVLSPSIKIPIRPSSKVKIVKVLAY